MADHYVGLNECAEYVEVGVAPYVSFDKVESGEMNLEGGEIQYNEGTGGQVDKFRGMTVPVGSLNTQVQTDTMLRRVKPAALGELPPVIALIHGGPLVGALHAREQSSCYIRNVAISGALDALIMASFDWVALRATQTTIAAPAAKQTNTGFPWHAGNVLFDGNPLKVQTWTATATCPIEARTSGDAKAPGVERLPEWFDPAPFQVTLEATVRTPPGIDMTADVIATMDFIATATNRDGVPKTLTVDLTGGNGLNPNGDGVMIAKGADEVLWSISATSEPEDFDVWNVHIA